METSIRTLETLKSILTETNIDRDHLFEVIKQGAEVERLSYSSKLILNDYSYLKSQKKILDSEKFLALLCCL